MTILRRPLLLLMLGLAFGVVIAACWGFLIGLFLAIVAPNGFPGVLLMIGSVIFGGVAAAFLSAHLEDDDG